MSLESDLDFYYNKATLGLKSNGSMDASKTDYHLPIHKYFDNFCTYNEPITDHDFREVRRYRSVATKLATLPIQSQRQLDALFNQQYRYPPELYAMFRTKYKDLTGLTLFTTLVKSLQELVDVKNKNQKSLEFAIKNEASLKLKQLQILWRKS